MGSVSFDRITSMIKQMFEVSPYSHLCKPPRAHHTRLSDALSQERPAQPCAPALTRSPQNNRQENARGCALLAFRKLIKNEHTHNKTSTANKKPKFLRQSISPPHLNTDSTTAKLQTQQSLNIQTTYPPNALPILPLRQNLTFILQHLISN
jgi:hypothetical protein